MKKKGHLMCKIFHSPKNLQSYCTPKKEKNGRKKPTYLYLNEKINCSFIFDKQRCLQPTMSSSIFVAKLYSLQAKFSLYIHITLN